MSLKKTLLFASLVLILILGACAAPPVVASDQTQENPPSVRQVSVTGTGQVTVAPDIAYVYIGVHSQSDNVAEALKENNDKAQAVAQALQDMGIAAEDIQTSSFNIYPQQQYGPQGEVTSTSYNVDNTVYVTVRDLTILGQLLDTAVRSGANSINGINFDVQDKTQAVNDARSQAVESARAQAQALADAAGVALGPLQSLNAYQTGSPVPMYEGKGGYAADASQVPISAGQIVIHVEVNATYLIQ